MSVIFGENKKLESFFKIPQFLYGDFSVFGVESHCQRAVEFALKQLRENRRIEVLVLLELDFNQNFLESLREIRSFGTQIYFFLKTQKKIPTLEIYKNLSKSGILFLYKV